MELDQIKTGDIELWRASLVETRKLKNITANHILATLKVMFGEAIRLQLIPFDPSLRVERYRSDVCERGILDLAEA